MAPLVVPNAWQVKMMFHDANASWSNIFGLDVGVIPVLTQGATDDIEDDVHDQWVAHLQALCPAEVFYDGVMVTDLRVHGAPQFANSTQSAAGTFVGDRLPDQLAVVVTLRTALRTRAGRGRMYLGGFGEGSNTAAGKIAAATSSACEDFVNDLRSALSGEAFSGDIGVISRKDPAFGFTGTIRPVTIAEVRDDTWDTQRRRVA